jgi:hypothetical protein
MNDNDLREMKLFVDKLRPVFDDKTIKTMLASKKDFVANFETDVKDSQKNKEKK